MPQKQFIVGEFSISKLGYLFLQKQNKNHEYPSLNLLENPVFI
jgi:hypothetical protein